MQSVFHKSIPTPVSADKAILVIQSLAVENDFNAIPMRTVPLRNSVMSITTVAVPVVLIETAIKTSAAKTESAFRSVKLILIVPMTISAWAGSAYRKSKANVNQIWNVAITWAVAPTKEDSMIALTYVKAFFAVGTPSAKFETIHQFANVCPVSQEIQPMISWAVKQLNA